MPFYFTLKRKEFTRRASQRLLALRRQIAREIPRRTVQDTLLLATWNIRDFDSDKFRHDESHMPAAKRDFDERGEPRDEAGKKSYYQRTWRTFQMSDHLPLWVELKIDFSNRYLKALTS